MNIFLRLVQISRDISQFYGLYISSHFISKFQKIIRAQKMNETNKTLQKPDPEENLPSQSSTIKTADLKKYQAMDFDQKAVLLCQFCGGETCPQQNFRVNKIQPNAIEGLHSNWITHNILAMQRPSDRLIKEYDLYKKFKNQRINTILNLQEPGEHPYCGDGLLAKVGFSYDPEGFYANGIKFFNQSWEDMTATTFQHMMRIMNIFYMSVIQDNGKISVHCHAGRGRTLLVICSWLIYWDRISATETINMAVQRRQGVLTKYSQRDFLKEFQQELKVRWACFGKVCGKTFGEFVEKQKVSLLKHEQNTCKFKPYLHSCVLNEFRRRLKMKDQQKEDSQPLARQILEALVNSSSQNKEIFPNKWSENDEKNLQYYKKCMDEHTLLSKVRLPTQPTDLPIPDIQKADVRILSQMIYDFYDEISFTPISAHAVDYLRQTILKSQKSTESQKVKIQYLYQPDFVHETGVEVLATFLDWVHFLREIITRSELNLIKEDSEDLKKCDSLFIRIALMLTSKRKYHPKIFSVKSGMRECRIMKYISNKTKKEEYTSSQVVLLSDYMRSILKQLPQQLSQIQNSILKKIRKIDYNLHYFSNSHESSSKEGFFRKNEAKIIYDKSRI